MTSVSLAPASQYVVFPGSHLVSSAWRALLYETTWVSRGGGAVFQSVSSAVASHPVTYGVVSAGPAHNAAWVLPLGEDLFLLRDGLVRLLAGHGFEIAAAVGSAPELLR